jgi:hypothetical protein
MNDMQPSNESVIAESVRLLRAEELLRERQECEQRSRDFLERQLALIEQQRQPKRAVRICEYCI